MKRNASFKEKLTYIYTLFLSLSLLFAALLILVRLYETGLLISKTSYNTAMITLLIKGLGFDCLYFLRISIFAILPFMLVAYFSIKAAKTLYATFAIILIIIDLALISYFAATRIPLGADLFGYSLTEIIHTTNASGQVSVLVLVPFILFIGLGIVAFTRFAHFTIHPFFQSALGTLFILSLFLGKDTDVNSSHYRNDFDASISTNKLSFFGVSSLHYWVNKLQDNKNVTQAIAVQQETNENPFEYISTDYPLLHKEKTPDLLGPYFTKNDSAPSVVFIIVESLGRAYCGEDAYLGSFTPFLDSLMQKSLYWENNISTTGRTFGVLPSILASLPFGKNGFAEMGDKMPNQLSILNLLKKNANYYTTFYYGGEANFDNMDLFMKHQGIDSIVDNNTFGARYQRLPAKNNGFSWGYGDREIFRKYLDDLKTYKHNKRIDVLLTIAMHNPFLIPNQSAYNQRVEDRMNTLNLSSKQKEFNKQYIPQFATILYFDDALRYFMQEFSKQKEFANTIFVITGDHRMPEIPISTQLDRFHVPLVIYSPLISKPQKFSSLVSHFDVTPTLLSYFSHNYGIKLPTVSAWIGHGLDNSVNYRSINSYPLMRNKSEFMDYLDNETFLSGQTNYQVDKTLDIEPLNNKAAMDKAQQKFENFKQVNSYVTENNKIIPDSLIIQFNH